MFYLILANCYLACFFAFYWGVLRKQTFFRWNRVYLLSGLVLAFALPALDISAWYDYSASYPQYLMGTGETVVVQGEAVEVAPSASFDWKRLVVGVYVVGCVLSFLYFLLCIRRTFRRLRTTDAGTAFSFFNIIRVDKRLGGHEQMEAHENVHAREWHSMDLILMQLVKVFNWFNPVVYYYERALRMQHEYHADDLTADGDELAYAELLVARAMRTERTALVHTFSSNRGLKSRVAMLLKDKSPNRNRVRFVLLVPLVVAMAIFSVACNQKPGGNSGSDRLSTDTPADTMGWASTNDDISLFTREIGKLVRYDQQAITDEKEGSLAFTFEKAKGGHIEQIKILNELWEGQQEQILGVLQSSRVDSLAPVGKFMGTVEFRISGKEKPDDQMPPPPPPVAVNYLPLPPVVIVGYSPKDAARMESSSAQEAEKAERKMTESEARRPFAEKEPVSENQIFQTVEVAPEPKGGMKNFMEFIGKNYDYPQEAIDAGVNGVVQISFIIEKDGSLTNQNIVKDLGYGTGEAALRVLEKSEKWSPGVQNGRLVRVAYTLPIRLNLQR